MVSGWLMFIISLVCFLFRFIPFSFCHLYYMGRENCGLLVIYAYKNTYPLAFCCFCEDGCDGICMDGLRWFQQFGQK